MSLLKCFQNMPPKKIVANNNALLQITPLNILYEQLLGFFEYGHVVLHTNRRKSHNKILTFSHNFFKFM